MPQSSTGSIFGACHHSPAEVVARVAATIGREKVHVIVAGESIPRRRAYVATSVGDLRSFATMLRRAHATVVVCDSLPALMSVSGLTIIDADGVTQHKARWKPMPLNIRKLSSHLRQSQPNPARIELVRDDIISRLITDIRKTGVLDKCLTFSHKLQSKNDRNRVQEIVLRYLMGRVKITYVESKLRPARIGTQTYQSYQDLVDSLKGSYGQSLQRAVVQSAAAKWAPDKLVSIATANSIDVFELRYLRTIAVKGRKTT